MLLTVSFPVVCNEESCFYNLQLFYFLDFLPSPIIMILKAVGREDVGGRQQLHNVKLLFYLFFVILELSITPVVRLDFSISVKTTSIFQMFFVILFFHNQPNFPGIKKNFFPLFSNLKLLKKAEILNNDFQVVILKITLSNSLSYCYILQNLVL